MFDFFKELPGQEARIISEIEPPERSINPPAYRNSNV